MGSSKSDSGEKENRGENGYYSLYDKSDYETRTYCSFNNIDI